MSRNRLYILIIIGLVIIAVVHALEIPVDRSVEDINMIYRRLETPTKMWLNGYLGHFFNFKFLGCLNWLIIPIGIYMVFRLKYLDQPWKKALGLSYILSLMLIGVKGYFNSRYQLTFLPLTLTAVVFFLWTLLEGYGGKIRNMIMLFLILLTLVNNTLGVFAHKTTAQGKTISRNGRILDRLTYQLDRIVDKFERLQKLDEIEEKTAYPVIDFIKELPQTDSLFLVNNLPVFYYYTPQKGVYYWCGDDTYYNENGRNFLMKDRSLEQLKSFLKDSLKCNYLLSMPQYNLYDAKFANFVQSYCRPVFMDDAEYVVYHIEDTVGNYSVEAMAKEISRRIKENEKPFHVRADEIEETK
ncbi:MAG: hypothetical protein MRY83_20975 [Flavobacteriales bacterium]|nr:hypothetical protein [Flavobacteriales bacterium]